MSEDTAACPAPAQLPPFPVDDGTLTLIEDSFRASLEFDDGGNATIVGGDFTFTRLLKFYSGYDESLEQPVTDDDGYAVPNMVEYPYPTYMHRDVILSLIAEVRRLRQDITDSPVQP